MNPTALYQVSLIAAFVAGMVALFAPCCISYLLPAYLGNVFKEKRKILLMTGIYALGIFAVILPIVLGAKILSEFFFRFHDQTYIVGGVLMVATAFFALFGIKLPMPHFNRPKGGTDILSTFVLGLVAGVTSACCAPVLVGVLTISSLSGSLLQALSVGLAYVLGMVAPLYLAALFIERGNFLARPIFRKQLFIISLGGNKYPVLITNLLAAIMFFGVGFVTLGLVFTGKLAMPVGPSPIVNNVAWAVTRWTERWPLANIVVGLGLVYLVYRFVVLVKKDDEKNNINLSINNNSKEIQGELYQCPECKLWYEDIEWMKKCEQWCKEHSSCNIEIISHSLQK
ncbi:MAG: cytochrome c biogenesis CcdA family protein [bacterium]|nr:cytochrome c biogenesis CcdA family protein [bacterium]